MGRGAPGAGWPGQRRGDLAARVRRLRLSSLSRRPEVMAVLAALLRGSARGRGPLLQRPLQVRAAGTRAAACRAPAWQGRARGARRPGCGPPGPRREAPCAAHAPYVAPVRRRRLRGLRRRLPLARAWVARGADLRRRKGPAPVLPDRQPGPYAFSGISLTACCVPALGRHRACGREAPGEREKTPRPDAA